MTDRERLIVAGLSEAAADLVIAALTQPSAPKADPGDPAPAPEPGDPTPDPEPGDPAPDPDSGDPTPDPEPGDPTPDPDSGDPIPDPDPDDSAPTLAAENAALRAALLTAQVHNCGLAAGVKPERLNALCRLVDASSIDPTAEDAEERVKAAVQAALDEVPELVSALSAPTGALGTHYRGTAQAPDAFSRGLLG